MTPPLADRKRLRGVLRFVGRAAVLIVALALFWSWWAPFYSRGIVAGANGLFAARGMSVRVQANSAGDLVAERLQAQPDGRLQWVRAPVGLRGRWEGLLLLLALVGATPRLGWRRRAVRLGLALALATGFYAVFVAAYFQALLSPQATPMAYFWMPLAEVAVPVLLWALLSLRDLLPRADA